MNIGESCVQKIIWANTVDTYVEEEEDHGNRQVGWMEEHLINAFNIMVETTGSARKAYRTFDNPNFRQSMHIPLALWKALGP